MKRLLFFLLLLPAFGLAQNPQPWYIKNSFYDTVRFYSPVYHLSYGVGSTSDSVLVITSTGLLQRIAQADLRPSNVTNSDKGDLTVSSGTWTIDNDAVTFGKFQNITQARLLGRYTASDGDMQQITIGSGLSLNSSTGELTASGSGVTTMAAVGSSPNANGATISGSTLTLQPADATNPGLITTGNQTWAGNKTFSGTIAPAAITSSAYLGVSETGSLSTPSSGLGAFWGHSDGTPRYTNDAGTTYTLSTGGATDLSDITAPLNVANALIFNGSQSGGVSAPAPYGEAKFNFYDLSGLSTNATFAAPAGTPAEFNMLYMRIQDNGTSRTLSWNAIYDEGSDLALPTATIAGQGLRLQFSYNGNTSKWELIGQTGGF